MSIRYSIDQALRLVRMECHGILGVDEIFDYQHSVWSRPEVFGFNELVDLSAIERINLPSSDPVRNLAREAAAMDVGANGTRLAILAPSDAVFGLARMYEAYRNMESKGTRTVGVFRLKEEALAFLGLHTG